MRLLRILACLAFCTASVLAEDPSKVRDRYKWDLTVPEVPGAPDAAGDEVKMAEEWDV